MAKKTKTPSEPKHVGRTRVKRSHKSSPGSSRDRSESEFPSRRPGEDARNCDGDGFSNYRGSAFGPFNDL